ncbi:MAG TPA: hypothetical protein VI454_01030 [Verrucomicrobiae bacterium]
MTAKIIAVLALVALAYGGYYLFNYYGVFEKKETAEQQAAAAVANGTPLPTDPNAPAEVVPGLPQRLETSLRNAYAGGATSLGKWLKTNRNYVADPRLASIELDYAALLARTDPAAARKVFLAVKARTPQNSPVNGRVKKLEAAYQ